MSDNLLTAGKEERELAIANGQYHKGVPAITVVVVVGVKDLTNTHTMPSLVLE